MSRPIKSCLLRCAKALSAVLALAYIAACSASPAMDGNPGRISTHTSSAATRSSASSAVPWSIAQAGQQYLAAVAPSNTAADDLVLAGPMRTNADLAVIRAMVSANQTFLTTLQSNRWPALVTADIAKARTYVAGEIEFYKQLLGESLDDINSSLKTGYDGDSFSAADIRSKLQLPPPPVSSDIGRTAHNLGATVVVKKVSISPSYQATNDYGNLGTVEAKQGTFVIVETEVLNDSDVPMDLTCADPIEVSLNDVNNRTFAAVDDLYKIPGNPECNANLQPGFRNTMTWIFNVPLTTHIDGLNFEDDTNIQNLSPFPTFISFVADT